MRGDPSELILLPGLDGTGRLFQWFKAEYAGSVPLRIVSYPAEPKKGYREFADDVRAMIGDRKVVVLGESYSGPIAVEIAASMPGQVKGLILAATFLRSPWPPWMMRIAARANPHLVPKWLMYAVLRGRSEDPALNLEIQKILSEMVPDVRSKRLRDVSDVDVRPRFAAVRCPILALHGRNDWLVPHSQVEGAVKSHPGATMRLLDGPHMLLQTNTKMAVREIEAFVEQIKAMT